MGRSSYGALKMEILGRRSYPTTCLNQYFNHIGIKAGQPADFELKLEIPYCWGREIVGYNYRSDDWEYHTIC